MLILQQLILLLLIQLYVLINQDFRLDSQVVNGSKLLTCPERFLGSNPSLGAKTYGILSPVGKGTINILNINIVNLTTNSKRIVSSNKVITFDKNSCDILFVLTDNGVCYSIPRNLIKAVRALTLGNKYNNCIVKL